MVLPTLPCATTVTGADLPRGLVSLTKRVTWASMRLNRGALVPMPRPCSTCKTRVRFWRHGRIVGRPAGCEQSARFLGRAAMGSPVFKPDEVSGREALQSVEQLWSKCAIARGCRRLNRCSRQGAARASQACASAKFLGLELSAHSGLGLEQL